MTITPLFTDAGLAAVTAASTGGLKANITHLAFGDVGHTPVSSVTALSHEVVRVPVDTYQNPEGGSLHLVSVLGDAVQEFIIREVGVILDDGTLLAIWSDPAVPASTKVANTDLTFTFAITLAGLPADSVNVTVVEGSGLDVLRHLISIATVQMDILAKVTGIESTSAADNTRMDGIADDIAALNVPADLEARLLALESGLNNLVIPEDRKDDIDQLMEDVEAISLPENLLSRLESLETTATQLGSAAFKNTGLLEGDIVQRVAHGALVGEGLENARPWVGQFKAYRSGDWLRMFAPGVADHGVTRLIPLPPVQPEQEPDGTN